MTMRANNTRYKLAFGIAGAAALLLVWLSLGVGIIGKDGDPANRMYFGVLAVGIIGALIARFRPGGMARALLATAIAQAVVAGIALIGGLGRPWSGALELSLLNGFFIALFLNISMALYMRSSGAGGPAGCCIGRRTGSRRSRTPRPRPIAGAAILRVCSKIRTIVSRTAGSVGGRFIEWQSVIDPTTPE
jgi:hypothetical protein